MSSSKHSVLPGSDLPHQGRWRQLIALLAANGVAWTGSRLVGIAIPWFVLTTTGSAFKTGAVVAAQMGPYVIAQALSGPFIDRVGPRKVSVIGDVIVASTISMVPVLHSLDLLSFPLLLVLLAVVGAADGPANSAKSVFIPGVAETANVPLERVTGLVGTVERTATVVGPAVAGVVVAAWGPTTSLWITAALSLTGALIIALGMPRVNASPSGEGPGYVEELKEGARFLRDDRFLLSLYSVIAISNLIDTAVFSVLLPVWAEQTGHGPAAIGLIASVLSATSIISSLIATVYGHRLPRRITYLVGFLVGGLPRFVVLAMAVPLGTVVVVHAFAGLFIGFLNPIIGALMFERVPAEMLGRVRTLGGSLAWAGIPFGGLVAGLLVGTIGLSPAFLVLGVVHSVVVVVPAFRPEWTQMKRG